MAPGLLLSFFIVYFVVLIGVSWLTSRNSSDNSSFFIANRNSKWYLVAFGMIGTAISGVTFISVPGKVNNFQFDYFQLILGNATGFLIVALIILPLYYRLKLTSIYTYLNQRFGETSHKTGSLFFLVSRTIGSAARLFLAANILQIFIFDAFNIPFYITVFICLLLIWSYTFRGGLKTIIWTDTLQTVFLVLAVALSILFISQSLNIQFTDIFSVVNQSKYSKIFFFDEFATSNSHFLKLFFGGVFLTIATVGLDQDLMQKNLSCKNIWDAQKNMLTFTGIFLVINLLFLCVGALLYIYAEKNGITAPLGHSDNLYPEIALNHLGVAPAIIFMLGLTAATFATTDSALTSLTTSYCVDFLKMDKQKDSNKSVNKRHLVHVAFSVIMLFVCIMLKIFNNRAIVDTILTIAALTYGPLLGLFSFGMLTKRKIIDKIVPIICIISPIFTYIISLNSVGWFGYKFKFELIILNGLITFLGLLLISKHDETFKRI